MSIDSYVLPTARTSYFMNVGTLIYGAGSSKTVGSEVKRLAIGKEPVLLLTDKGCLLYTSDAADE